MRTKLFFVIAFIGMSGFVQAQCLKLSDLAVLIYMQHENQNNYLKAKGYILQENSFMPESFGWDWKNPNTNTYVNIKRHEETNEVTMVQYRLLNDKKCFNSLMKAAKKEKIKKDYQKITSSTNYNYYKSLTWGLETADWMNEKKKYYQFNLINLKYFDELKHHWDSY